MDHFVTNGYFYVSLRRTSARLLGPVLANTQVALAANISACFRMNVLEWPLEQRPAVFNDLLLTNVRRAYGSPVNIAISNGHIKALGTNLSVDSDYASYTAVDGENAMVLPGLIEGHTHLDKTHWGMPWYRNDVGSRLTDRIDNERQWRAATQHDAGAQSLALARAFLAAGTTRIRTHVDIDTDAGLRHLEGVLRTRETLQALMQIQIVAFPQSGMLVRAGTRELLDQALREGADVVGALDPNAIDRDPVASLDATFALAEHHQKPIDLHLHEPAEMGAATLHLVLDRVAALGMQGRVVVSHAFCLGALAPRERDPLLARIAELDVALLTTAPASVDVPPWQACQNAGVTLFAGNDGIRDTWTPYGKPDMLERAMLLGLRYNLRRDAELAMAFDCVTTQAARGCGFDRYGMEAGCRADLMLVDSETLAQAIVERPVRKLVIAAGQIVARDGHLVLGAAGLVNN